MGGEALQRLEDGARRTARDLVAGLDLAAPVAAGARPRVVADMVATVDGRAAVQGRSIALGHPADRALLRELRTAVDAILVGSGTLAAERYANLLDDEQRARRVADGRSPHPLVVTLSRRLTLPRDVPLFDEAGVPIVVFTHAGKEVGAPVLGADLEVVRVAAEAPLSASALVALGARGVRSVLCEGGPTLLGRLVADGGLDDLLLTVSPLLAAGTAPTVLDGAPFVDPTRLALREVHRADNHVFLHYGLAR
ncbi:MAG TPA: dihydrofolate reductase family protein [Baekduia sp.]|nr:dihydrofolate reductase family protein [Baekduia sp.]